MKKSIIVTLLASTMMLGMNSHAAEHLWRILQGDLNNNLAPAVAPGVWLLDSTTNQPIRHTQWNVNEWTQAGIPVTTANQASVNPSWYGSTSVQWNNAHFAAFLHTWSINPSPSAQQGVTSLPFGGSIGNGLNFAWNSNQFGSEARACVSVKAKVSNVYFEPGAAIFNYVNFGLFDASTNHEVHLLMSLWDTRAPGQNGTVPHYVWYDWAAGIFAGTRVAHDSPYVTLTPGSSEAGYTAGHDWRNYDFCITRQQITRLANDVNADVQRQYPLVAQQLQNEAASVGWDNVNPDTIKKYQRFTAMLQSPLSTDPNQWRIEFSNMQPEFAPALGHGHVGFAFQDFRTFTRY